MHLIECPMIGWNQENHIFINTGAPLKQEFSDGLQISMNIKRYYYTFDNSLLFTESIQNTTQIFHAKS